jgi:hypothetical protein
MKNYSKAILFLGISFLPSTAFHKPKRLRRAQLNEKSDRSF